MKAACAKCAILETPPVSPSIAVQENSVPSTQNENNQDATKFTNEVQNENENSVNPPLTFNPEKLHQAILAYRPVSL